VRGKGLHETSNGAEERTCLLWEQQERCGWDIAGLCAAKRSAGKHLRIIYAE